MLKNSLRSRFGRFGIKFGIICFTLGSNTFVWASDLYTLPNLVSFEFSPSEIELTGESTVVNFQLTANHPIGIESSSVEVTLKSSENDTLSTILRRTDSPINLTLKNVIFKGSLEIPRNVKSGAYVAESGSIIGMPAQGGLISPRSPGFKVTKKLNNVVGAEESLIIRNQGNLNLNFDTFVGPSHTTNSSTAREFPKLPVYKTPIWKVGESYVPEDYFEPRVPNLKLEIVSKTKNTCDVKDSKLKFLAEGDCNFIVFTPLTRDYKYKQFEQLVQITSSRKPQELITESIGNQVAQDLPKLIKIPRVYTIANGYITPKTLSPEICLASDGYMNIFSGGLCKYSYQSMETGNFMASEIYELSFEVVRKTQVITFNPQKTINLNSKNLKLDASSSSGGVVTLDTKTTKICSIDSQILTLFKPGNCEVVANQVGTSTYSPASLTVQILITGVEKPKVQSITCFKGKKIKYVNSLKPKCPVGFKVK